MLRKLGIAFVVGLAALLLYVASRPDTFRVERSASIAAPAEKIFPMIEDFHRWGPWSPYEKRDPAMKRTYSGAPSGPGAVYAWEGNRDIGKGRMEITDSSPPLKDTIKLDFFKPFEGHNIAEFTLEPKGDVTNVSWVMYGPVPFISKVMQVFVDMDNMIGKDFEAGLANLKAMAEK